MNDHSRQLPTIRCAALFREHARGLRSRQWRYNHFHGRPSVTPREPRPNQTSDGHKAYLAAINQGPLGNGRYRRRAGNVGSRHCGASRQRRITSSVSLCPQAHS